MKQDLIFLRNVVGLVDNRGTRLRKARDERVNRLYLIEIIEGEFSDFDFSRGCHYWAIMIPFKQSMRMRT